MDDISASTGQRRPAYRQLLEDLGEGLVEASSFGISTDWATAPP
jgi:hypothetical protein